MRHRGEQRQQPVHLDVRVVVELHEPAQRARRPLGAQLGAVAGPIGASREASVAAQPSAAAPVFTYSLSRGLFAGVSLEGSSINERNSVNERHYQRVGVRASELLQGLVPPRPAARGLLSALDALDAADGAVVSPQPAPPAYSDNNPFS